MKKKVKLNRVKPGQKFRYKRKLCVMDDLYTAIVLSTGTVVRDDDLPRDSLVTPVRVQIRVL